MFCKADPVCAACPGPNFTGGFDARMVFNWPLGERENSMNEKHECLFVFFAPTVGERVATVRISESNPRHLHVSSRLYLFHRSMPRHHLETVYYAMESCLLPKQTITRSDVLVDVSGEEITIDIPFWPTMAIESQCLLADGNPNFDPNYSVRAEQVSTGKEKNPSMR